MQTCAVKPRFILKPLFWDFDGVVNCGLDDTFPVAKVMKQAVSWLTTWIRIQTLRNGRNIQQGWRGGGGGGGATKCSRTSV